MNKIKCPDCLTPNKKRGRNRKADLITYCCQNCGKIYSTRDGQLVKRLIPISHIKEIITRCNHDPFTVIARDLGVTKSAVGKIATKHFRREIQETLVKPKHREAYNLHLEGLTVAQIAEQLGSCKDSVKVWIRRVRYWDEVMGSNNDSPHSS